MAKKKKKLRLDLLVLCDYATISRENKLSILGIFEHILVRKTPAQHLKMFVVGIVEGEPNSKHVVRLRIKDPSGKELLPIQELKAHLGPNGRSNLVTELGNLPIPLTGVYSVELSTAEEVLGKKELIVLKTGGRDDRPGKAGAYN